MYKIVITTCTEMKYINNNECNDNGIDIDNDNDNDRLMKIMTKTQQIMAK